MGKRWGHKWRWCHDGVRMRSRVRVRKSGVCPNMVGIEWNRNSPLYFRCVLWGGNSRVWTWRLNRGTGSCISFWQFIFQNSYVLIPGLGEGQHEQPKVDGLENHNETSQHGNRIEKLYHRFWVHRGQRAILWVPLHCRLGKWHVASKPDPWIGFWNHFRLCFCSCGRK